MIDLITEQLRNNQITAIQALEQAAEHTNAGPLLRDAAFKMAEQCANFEEEIKSIKASLKALQDSDDDAYNRGWNAALYLFTNRMSSSLNELKK